MTIDPIESQKNGENKALDAWAAMQAVHAERRLARENNNSVSAAPTDNDNKISDSNREGFSTNTAIGNVGTTGVNTANNPGGSSSGNQQQGFTGGGHQDQAIIRAQYATGGLADPAGIKFVSQSPEEREITGMQERVISQYENRYGIALHDDVKNAIRNMTDKGELASALKTMATGKRSDIQAPQVHQFEETLMRAHADFFTPIDETLQ